MKVSMREMKEYKNDVVHKRNIGQVTSRREEKVAMSRVVFLFLFCQPRIQSRLRPKNLTYYSCTSIQISMYMYICTHKYTTGMHPGARLHMCMLICMHVCTYVVCTYVNSSFSFFLRPGVTRLGYKGPKELGRTRAKLLISVTR